MARVADSMVTFQDLDDMVTFEGFSYVANPITPPANLNTCANKVKVLGYLDVNLSRTLADNQLVSYSIIVLPAVTDTLTIIPKNKGVDSSPKTYVITVESNTAWTVSESLGWASLSATSGTGNGSITVTLLENTSTSDRSGAITFTTGDVNESHTITQVADTLSISPQTKTMDSIGQQYIIDVTSNTGWTVSENLSWLSFTSTSSLGNSYITVTVIENTSNSSRSGIIAFSTGNRNENHSITQEAAEELSISPQGKTISDIQQTYDITVTSNTSWSVSESLSWVNVIADSGSGNDTVTVTALENTSTSSRSGTITFTTSGGLTEEHGIDQFGKQ